MSFKQRLTLFTTVLLIVAVTLTTAVLSWNAKKQLLATAETEGTLVALLLARSAGAAVAIPPQVENVLSDQMISQATLTAYFVAAAEQAGLSPGQISQRLADISQTTSIDEFWVTDPSGVVYLTNSGFPFTFSPDPAVQPQASQFWPLLTGEKKVVVQPARERELDGLVYKYVGVTGVDKPRIVEVGYEVQLLEDLNARIGLEYMIQHLISAGDVDAIWVVDPTMMTIAHGSILSAGSVTRKPDLRELKAMEEVFSANRPMSFLTDDDLTVMAPVPGGGAQPVGVTLVRLPTEEMRQAVRRLHTIAILVGLIIAVTGGLCALLLGQRMVQPVITLSAAAGAVQDASFQAEQLATVAARPDELGQLARTFTAMAAQVFARQEELDHQVKARTIELEEKNDQLASAHQLLQDELEVARALQLSILPTEFPHQAAYQVFARMTPAREMGGDFYDIFAIDEKRVGILVADVSGKGVPAAFFMAVARTELHTTALDGAPPSKVLELVNDKLCAENPLELFVTVFYAILELDSGRLCYANGGHNPPYHVRQSTATALATTNGVALGVFPDVPYQEQSLQLDSGDALHLYTDGVTEAFNSAAEEFGGERLQRLLEASAGTPSEEQVAAVFSAVEQFSRGVPQSDDITSLCLVYGSQTESDA